MRDFNIVDGRIHISADRKAPKPITGTKLGGVTGDNPYQTDFVVFMDLFRFSIPFQMNVPVKVGMALEDAVVDGVNKVEGMNFGPYEKKSSGFMARFYDWDTTTGIGTKYNGLIDGWDKEKKIVLECKISNVKNNLRSQCLETGVDIPAKYGILPPIYYLLQMMLYGKLSDAKEIWLSAYFMTDEDYAGITLDTKDDDIRANFNFDPAKLELYKYTVNQGFKDKLQIKIDIAENFFKNHLDPRISPKPNPAFKCDVELLYTMLNKGELTIDEVNSLLEIENPSLEDIFRKAGGPKYGEYNVRNYMQARDMMLKSKSSIFDALCRIHWIGR